MVVLRGEREQDRENLRRGCQQTPAGQPIPLPHVSPPSPEIDNAALTIPPIPSPAMNPAATAYPYASNVFPDFLAQVRVMTAPITIAVPYWVAGMINAMETTIIFG
jgi:hypothetical protein